MTCFKTLTTTELLILVGVFDRLGAELSFDDDHVRLRAHGYEHVLELDRKAPSTRRTVNRAQAKLEYLRQLEGGNAHG